MTTSDPEKAGSAQSRGKAEDLWARHERRFAEQVIENVRHYKKERRLTAKALAERAEVAGWPINLNTINGMLGSKKRASVSITELLALAEALGVPPVALMLPLYGTDPVEVLPGKRLLPLDFYRMFIGERMYPLAAGGRDESDEPHLAREAIARMLRYITANQEVHDHVAALALTVQSQERTGIPDVVIERRRLEAVEALRAYKVSVAELEKIGVAVPQPDPDDAWLRHIDPEDLTLQTIEEVFLRYVSREEI